jgi:hypothetical protein
MWIRPLACAAIACLPSLAAQLQLNSLALDPSLFNVTDFAGGLQGPISAVQLSDGSIAIASYWTGIQRFTDSTGSGVADGPGTTIYGAIGAHTGLVQAGNYYIDGNSGDFIGGTSGPSITILKPAADPAAPLTAVGSLQFSFPANWEHNQMGIATRPTPGQPGSYDLVFNVGAEFNDQPSTDKVQVSGLANATLTGDSLYAVTINLNGPQPVASNLRQIATGIRNVIGMGFQPGTGDFYFADNAIDGPGPDGDEPPQSDEIDLIPSSEFGEGPPINFGYPDCYIQYRTGAQIGSGCVQPFFAIQPIPNGTLLGSESEGPAQLVFAPPDFPAGFNNGIFIGFSGKGSVTGPANEENAVGYFDFTTGTYIHFSENSQQGVYQPIGLLATSDALYISDFGGTTYEVTAATPEPESAILVALALAGFLAWKKGAFDRMRENA